jgi:hypothetical protein
MKTEKIAFEFSRILRGWMTPEKWADMVAKDRKSDFSNANDFCDANQALIDAFILVVGREPRFPSDVDAGFATESDVDADSETLDEAWRLARAEWVKGGIA